MTINIELIKTIILLFPGIITVFVAETLSGRKENKFHRDFFKIILYSFIIYLVLFLIGTKILKMISFTILDFLVQSNNSVNWMEVVYSIPMAVVLGFFLAFFYKIKILNLIGQFFKVTNRYGDEDLWEYWHNASKNEWFVVHDHKLGLWYYGTISVFSESREERELIMRDVDVHKFSNGEKLYTTSALYLSRHKHDISIQIPAKGGNNESKSKKK